MVLVKIMVKSNKMEHIKSFNSFNSIPFFFTSFINILVAHVTTHQVKDNSSFSIIILRDLIHLSLDNILINIITWRQKH